MKNNYIKMLSIQCCMIIFCFYSCVGKNQQPDIYNLSFDKYISNLNYENSWKISGCLSHIISRDTIEKREGTASAKIKVSKNNACKDIPLRIYQTIKTPCKANEIKYSFWLKRERLTSGTLKVIAHDSCENVVFNKKTLLLPTDSDWKQISGIIEDDIVQMLYIEIEIESGSIIWIDDLEILLDDNNIYEVAGSTARSNPLEQAPINITDKVESLSQLLDDLERAKIIGIGETSHGIEEMADIRNRIIKELILKERCRLVVFECPELYAEHLNRYVQGHLTEEMLFKSEDIAKTQYYNLSEKVLQLLKFIRQYNDASLQKVTVAGMDVSNGWHDLLRQSFPDMKGKQDLKKVNKYLNMSESDSILIYLNENQSMIISEIGRNKFDSIYSTAVKFNRFVEVYSSFFNDASRDSIMAMTVVELTKKYTTKHEKTAVVGHLTHLNKQNNHNSLNSSVGSHLSEYFDDRYYVIGLMVGEGNYQAYQIDPEKLNIKQLELPVDGSLEFYSSKISSRPFYYRFPEDTSDKNMIMSYRFLGGIPKSKQFFPGNPYKRFNAFVYFPQGNPLLLLPIYEAIKY